MTIAVRQVGSWVGTSGFPVTVSLPGPPIADGTSVLVLYGLMRDADKTVDSDGALAAGGWHVVTGGFTNPAGGTDTAALLWVQCTDVAQQNVLVQVLGASGTGHLVLVELSGADPTSVQAGAPTVGTVDTFVLGAVTPPAGRGAVILGGLANNGSVGTSTPATGWTHEYHAFQSGPAHAEAVVLSKTVAVAAGSYAPSSTLTDGDKWQGVAIAFSASVAPTVDPPIVPPPTEPGLALVEIFASVPGSSRWGVATWGNGLWSSAGWQDVTPQSVDAKISWGSKRPELGILSRPDAGAWTIATYDPDRLLDPSNADSVYATDLQPGLPIRITHRGVVIRQGTCDVISHAMARHTGLLRVIDNQSGLANTAVPLDTTLPDTLYARARAAIAACGLVVEVLPDPPAGDPDLVPWETGTSWTAWQWISDAAEQVLHVPYIDRLGRLGFRAWAVPLARGRQLSSPELVDLIAIVDLAGLYSVVQARQTDGDGGDLIERRLTPPPAYGARVTTRDDPVLDPDAWADAVLADRAIGGIRWVPGMVRPLDADSTELLATMEAVELVSMLLPEQDPAIAVNAIIVGGEIALTAKRDDAAVWGFRFEAAQADTMPLFADDEDPPAFLVAEDGDQYLFPG